MPTLIDNLYQEEDINFNFRRKSCHCSKCGPQTNLEKKVDLYIRKNSAKNYLTRKSTIRSSELDNINSFSKMPASSIKLIFSLKDFNNLIRIFKKQSKKKIKRFHNITSVIKN